jgi:hypothetical protein
MVYNIFNIEKNMEKLLKTPLKKKKNDLEKFENS